VEGGRTAGSSGGQLASRAVGIQAHKNRKAVSAWDGGGNERWYEWCGRLMGGDWERERERAAASAYHALCVRPPQHTQSRAVRLCAASGRCARAATLAAGLSAGRLDSCALMDLAASWHGTLCPPITHSAAGREGCTSARGGRLTPSRQRQ
jgi:hypothetical protein